LFFAFCGLPSSAEAAQQFGFKNTKAGANHL